MRRSDRQVTDPAAVRAIIHRCTVMRLSLCRSGMPYVVPMNFGCEWEGDLPVLYAHCAHDGLKLDILRENSNVCVEMDSGGELIQGAKRRSHPNCAAHALRQGLRL